MVYGSFNYFPDSIDLFAKHFLFTIFIQISALGTGLLGLMLI